MRLKRVIRGVVGTGVAFAVGGGAVIATIGTLLSLLGGPPLRAVFQTAARGSVLGFLIGVVFSGLLAIGARGRTFESLSLRRFAGLGVGVGWSAWLLMGLNGAFKAWSVTSAISNLILLTLMGGGSAAAILVAARRVGQLNGRTTRR